MKGKKYDKWQSAPYVNTRFLSMKRYVGLCHINRKLGATALLFSVLADVLFLPLFVVLSILLQGIPSTAEEAIKFPEYFGTRIREIITGESFKYYKNTKFM